MNTSPNHYVLCQHGLFGGAIDFKNITDHFKQTEGIKLIVLTASAFAPRTLDGVAAGGRRCCDEILELVRTGQIAPGSAVSVLGHSLGGLYLRYALRLIERDYSFVWEEYMLTRRVAVFIATPHCGIQSSAGIVTASSKCLFRHLCQTPKDLVLDSPVLEELCDEVGIRALNNFNRIVLYGNIARDGTVSASSALILPAAIPITRQDPATMTITEWVMQSEELPTGGIVEKLNTGLKNVSRFLVECPRIGWFVPGIIDNSGHTRIISHPAFDRSKVGQPMIDHLENIFR
jgi:hypothetical protein